MDIIDIMKSVYNFKASDDELPWNKKKELLVDTAAPICYNQIGFSTIYTLPAEEKYNAAKGIE